MPTLATRPPSPSPSQLPPVPSSPTYSYASMTTSAASPAPNITMSSYNLPLPPPPPSTAHAVLTKADLAASQSAYATLLTTAKAYRLALATLSTAASAFGSALESCARLKEARADSLAPGSAPIISHGHSHSHSHSSSQHQHQQQHQQHILHSHQPTASSSCTADSLLAAAGVQHLIANHEQILSETVYRSFEVPLLHELDKWRRDVDDEQTGYLAAVKKQSADIRRLERDGLRLHRQRGPRDVAQFRSHLVDLTTRLDGLTALHGEHAHTLLRESQDTSVKILDASCSLVRAEVDIFESLARKGWSGGGLDDILEKGTDLFAAAGDEYHIYQHQQYQQQQQPQQYQQQYQQDGGKLFSILPPKSILADTTIRSDSTERLRGRSPAHKEGGPRGGSGGGGGGGHNYHRRTDSLGVAAPEMYQSLVGAVGGGGGEGEADTDTDVDADAASLFSADLQHQHHHYPSASTLVRPRMTRPFSPQPVRVAPDDVMGSGGRVASSPEAAAAAVVRDRAPAGSSDSEGEEEGSSTPSSPETIRDDDDDDVVVERPWDSEGGGGGVEDKRMSTAASDPDERERRWHAEASGDETV